MNKVIKWTVISGLVFCLLGIGVMFAGVVNGGGEKLKPYFNQISEHENWHSLPTLEHVSDDPMQVLNQVERYEGIDTIKLEIRAGEVTIVEDAREDASDTSISIARYGIEGKNVYGYEIEQEGAEMKIKPGDGVKRLLKGMKGEHYMERLEIHVPEGYVFREVEAEVLGGRFYADMLESNILDLEVKAGEAVIEDGSVSILKADCQAGSIVCMAKVESGADVECKAGSVEFSLAEEQDQYDYWLQAKTGSIRFIGEEEEEYSGLWNEKHMDHNTGRRVKLETAAGEIIVRLPEAL